MKSDDELTQAIADLLKENADQAAQLIVDATVTRGDWSPYENDENVSPPPEYIRMCGKMARSFNKKYWDYISQMAEKKLHAYSRSADFEKNVASDVKFEIQRIVTESVEEKGAELVIKVQRIIEAQTDEMVKACSRHLVDKISAEIVAAYKEVDLMSVVRKSKS